MPMSCIGITSGEVMQNIQEASAAGAYFVLPSQLNGAEYPSEVDIVQQIQDYIYDNTGGPRGQLAVHPAAGQFILANACSDRLPEGITAVDEILEEIGKPMYLKNGYLSLPRV